jgi:hypothetical protein
MKFMFTLLNTKTKMRKINKLIVGTVSGMVTCRLEIRCRVLICNLNSCKITNNSSGVLTTPTPMPKSVQINFLKSVYNFTSSNNACVFIPGAMILFIGR